MTINKEFIPCNCNKQDCPYFSSCDMTSTEVIRHDGREGIDILIFGMGSGKEESKLKRCFVGRAGKYMRSIIQHMWNQSGVFNIALSNNVRFHPMDENGKDREPTVEEISRCLPFLEYDIINLQPRAIVPVGRNATSTLQFIGDTAMGKLRGRPFEHSILYSTVIGRMVCSTKIVPTWHPSYLCRSYGSFDPSKNNLYDNHFMSDIRLALE